jgi:hypothetical protein
MNVTRVSQTLSSPRDPKILATADAMFAAYALRFGILQKDNQNVFNLLDCL